MTQDVRAIDWHADATATILRKLRAAEGHPGVLDEIGGTAFHLFGGHEEGALRGTPGKIVAQRDGAICRATVDGAVWITTLKQAGEGALKLPATLALERAGLVVNAPERPVPVHAPPGACATYREIAYEEDTAAGVGYLRFAFHNGAMSTEQCRRLQDAYAYARSRRRPRSSCCWAGGTSSPTASTSTSSRRPTIRPGSPGSTCTRSTTSCATSSRPTRTSSSRP